MNTIIISESVDCCTMVTDLGDLADMDSHQRMDSTGVIGDKDKYLSHSFQNFRKSYTVSSHT